MKRFRTWFDNSLSRRGALAFWAVLAILGLVIVGTFFLRAVGAVPIGDPEVSDLPAWVQVSMTSLTRSLGIAPPQTLLAGALTLWFWFIGLLVMGTIFAWRTNALTRTSARILAGRTPITDRGHTVILGWSPIVPVLVRELALSAGKGTLRTVALLSSLDRRASMDALEDVLGGEGSARRLRLVTRSGDPWNPSDLRRVNCGAARTIVVVDDPAKSEYSSVTLAFAASTQREDDHQVCIVQVRNTGMKSIVEGATDARYIALTSEDVILRALAQSARQPGVTEALFELLDFDGSEIHRQLVDGVAGLTYAEVASRLVGATAIGVVRRDGSILVNPPAGTIIGDGEPCLLVKQSADDLAVLGRRDEEGGAVIDEVSLSIAAEPHVGIVGPVGPASRVAENLQSFLSGGAAISIFSRDPVARSDEAGGASVCAHQVTDYFGDLAERLATVGPDQVVVLADAAPDTSAAEIDAKTAVIVAAARQMLASLGRDVRFVAQVLDPASRALIPVRASDDLIVSEEASAMMIAQAAADPVVFGVLVDLLDPSVGSAIHVLGLPEQRGAGRSFRFRDLVEVGLRSDVSVIGWRYLSPDAGWRVDLCVDRDAVVPDVEGFGVLAIAGSTQH